MPKTAVVFYHEDKGTVRVLDWLDRLPAEVQDKCRVRIERLRIWAMNYAARKRITCGMASTSCASDFGA
jgi:hypothetical protein